ncbi:MAG TPA: ATP-binding protein, partial [Polyangiales bacterium]|nr:ATP-binding protein [Polyangiales bacterium]
MTAAGYVMVIDDDEALRDSVCELLDDHGFRAIGFDSAEAALRCLREEAEKPSVILLDLMLPIMSGWAFREAQLRDAALASIPVVAMTASRDARAIQADDIVYKPIKTRKLLELVRGHTHDSAAAARGAAVPTRLTPTPDTHALFAGGGELGRRMAEMDWASTELGPVESWPQSLRTCVRIILTSRQPMFVWWGESLINLYNDAYKSIIGGKHPTALGQPASVVWREIWSEVHPRASRAMLANEGTYDEALLLIMERHGYQEETYYTFSYSPVPNDQGGTGGIICANSADTQRIIGERQLALLRELAGRTSNARTVDAACSLAASALATNARDLPFALLYVNASDRLTFELRGTAGFDAGHEHTALTDPATWPLAQTLDSHHTHVVDLEPRHGQPPRGAWDRPPARAALVPIALSGDTGRAGVLVAGLNPFRVFDESYRGFLELVAGQISASIANAQAYEEERKRAEALAEIDRAKTAFFSNVSHEFRTPLTLMLGPAHDLLKGVHGKLAEEQRREIEVVQRNGLRLQKLVNSLLDFARLEAGRVQASYEAVDLSTVTRELASAFEYAFQRAGVPLVVDCPPLAEPVFVDRDMWDKIVLNLLSNALKFTFEGRVVISLQDDGSEVALRVKDTGVGIPAEQTSRVFERFHRIEGTRSRTHEGSGIGLALVQELAKLHGGHARVESALGRGSTFTVSIPKGSAHLPRDRIGARHSQVPTALGAAPFVEEALRWLPSRSEPARAPHTDRTLPAVIATPRPAAAGRILLADDNADMRDYVRRLLGGLYDVETVSDGEAALEAARACPPDLVLSDVMMPEMD